MTIVDTHCHAGTDKYEPIESLLFHMDEAGVDKAVLIQQPLNSVLLLARQVAHRHFSARNLQK